MRTRDLLRRGVVLFSILTLAALLCAARGQAQRISGVRVERAPTDSAPAGTKFRECPECPEMAVVPPGSFERSSKVFTDSDERPENDEYTQPAREVVVPKAFAVSVYPVTREEYAAFVGDTNRQSAVGCKVWDGEIQWKLDLQASWANPGFAQTDRDPVVCVSWEDAQAYLQWLNARAQGASRLHHFGLGPYHLLSWEEAEHAARGGVATPFYWGDKPYRDQANSGADDCNPCNGALGGRDRWIHTSPVGSFPPNPFGLYDMAGNVWTITDTVCWGESAICRVAHGGSWLDKPQKMRTDEWTYFYSLEHANDTGFRVARSLEKEKSQ